MISLCPEAQGVFLGFGGGFLQALETSFPMGCAAACIFFLVQSLFPRMGTLFEGPLAYISNPTQEIKEGAVWCCISGLS